jgi:hypothetical protein
LGVLLDIYYLCGILGEVPQSFKDFYLEKGKTNVGQNDKEG